MGGLCLADLALGWRTVASAVTTVDAEGEALTSVNVQRSLPLGPGFGFRIDADAQEPYRTTGVFEVQGRRGILGVRADGSQEDKTVGTVNLAGSIVAIGGEVLLSRPVDDGFALVKVPNSRGVRVSRTISCPGARAGADRCSSPTCARTCRARSGSCRTICR